MWIVFVPFALAPTIIRRSPFPEASADSEENTCCRHLCRYRIRLLQHLHRGCSVALYSVVAYSKLRWCYRYMIIMTLTMRLRPGIRSTTIIIKMIPICRILVNHYAESPCATGNTVFVLCILNIFCFEILWKLRTSFFLIAQIFSYFSMLISKLFHEKVCILCKNKMELPLWEWSHDGGY